MGAKERLDKANELKLEGNDSFKASQWTQALVSYRTALHQLPPRKQLANPDPDEADVDAPQQPSAGDSRVAAADVANALDVECQKARAILHANIGACLAKLASAPVSGLN